MRAAAAQKALSQQEVDNAGSARPAARATVGAQQAAVEQARLNVSQARVTSAISGIAGLASQQVGDRAGRDRIITDGLQHGDRVIIEGFARVKSGMKVVPQDAATAIAAKQESINVRLFHQSGRSPPGRICR